MNKSFILKMLGLIALLGGFVIAMGFAMKDSGPPKSYKIRIKEITYETDTYFIDGEYIIFRDEFGRDVEVHKNFATVEVVK